MQKFILKRSIVRFNFFLSIGFGILMGIVFPLFSMIFVVFKSDIMKIIFCLGCIIAGIIVGFMAFLITRLTILRVVKDISLDLEEIARGEGDLTKSINIESDDDVGKLIHWFNQFVVRLCKMVNSTKQSIVSTKNKSNKLTSQMSSISASLRSILGSVQEIKETQKKQNSKINNIENSLVILDDSVVIVITSVMEFFNQLDLLTDIVISQSKSIDEIIGNISQVSGEIGTSGTLKAAMNSGERSSLFATGSDLINNTYRLVENFKQNTLMIEENLRNIEDLSFNINLIAINASIEAAQSGTSGRGFHVVADEIRRFADLTKKFTRDIQDVLNEISSDMEHRIDDIRNSQVKYNTTLKEVSKTTDNLYNATNSIKTVTEDIKSNYKTIGELLMNLKEKIESLKENSSSCHTALAELQSITESVNVQMEKIDLESNEINNNGLYILNDFYNLIEDIKNVEEQISRYNTGEL